MADLRPTRTVADERTTLLGLLQFQRDSILRKVDGLRDPPATREIVPSGTTLLWLVWHLTTAEITWVLHRFAGENVELPAEGQTLAATVAAYRDVWPRVDAIVAASELDDLCRGLGEDGDQANLRWVLGHLLEETARHAGHADILRELIDGHTGR